MKKTQPAKLKFHGVRGSRPIHSVDLLGFGGNTTCLEILTELNFKLIIDGGTGLQRICAELEQNPHIKKIHILMTHTHWDHLLYLPLLSCLFDQEYQVNIYAADVGGKPFEELFHTLFKFGLFPVERKEIRADLRFHSIKPDQDFLIEGKIKISTFQVNHQHITLGYKIQFGDANVAIITDAASVQNGNLLGQGMIERAHEIGKENFEVEYQQKLISFLTGIHSLVYDTHFNEKNLKSDWGHSCPEIAIDLCIQAGIKRLFMFHHAPEENDRQIARKQLQAQYVGNPSGIEIINAKEEDEWLLKSS